MYTHPKLVVCSLRLARARTFCRRPGLKWQDMRPGVFRDDADRQGVPGQRAVEDRRCGTAGRAFGHVLRKVGQSTQRHHLCIAGVTQFPAIGDEGAIIAVLTRAQRREVHRHVENVVAPLFVAAEEVVDAIQWIQTHAVRIWWHDGADETIQARGCRVLLCLFLHFRRRQPTVRVTGPPLLQRHAQTSTNYRGRSKMRASRTCEQAPRALSLSDSCNFMGRNLSSRSHGLERAHGDAHRGQVPQKMPRWAEEARRCQQSKRRARRPRRDAARALFVPTLR